MLYSGSDTDLTSVEHNQPLFLINNNHDNNNAAATAAAAVSAVSLLLIYLFSNIYWSIFADLGGHNEYLLVIQTVLGGLTTSIYGPVADFVQCICADYCDG